ncbi:MAG TPA: ABC transporter permease [Candidatus Acidoferrum sp.]|nr:ABC transporter permease [Candidatus Acidoferrum sp.]
MSRRKRMLENLDADIRDHIERETQDNIDRGMPPEEARRAAFLKFGNTRRVKEDTHRVWTITWLEQLLWDVNYALRMLRKTPVITAIALLSLALGIGANTAIFSLIDAVMLRMLPVRDPQQLAQIEFRWPDDPNPRSSFTNPLWEQVRDHQDAFSGVIAWAPETFDLADGGEVSNVQGIYASGGYFDVLGVRPAAGRLFSLSDDVRGCSGVAVLGYGLWQSRYGGAESVVGRFIRLDGHSFPIVGVAQRGFTGTDVGDKFDVAVPICAEGILQGKDSGLDERAYWWLLIMGRLKPGVTLAQADARMKGLSPQLFGAVVPELFPSKQQAMFRKNTFSIASAETGTAGPDQLRQQYNQPLEILMIVVGLVLLIACANIASFLVARCAARQKEIAVRLSLGASRGRLIRQVLTESVVLSGLGASLGVLFARWSGTFLLSLVSRAQNQVFLDLKMDGRVLAFTICVAVFCGLLFGVLPAFRATRVSAMSAMKEGQTQGGTHSQSSSVRWIIAAQLALSLILLVGTGLLIHTFANLMTVSPGFNRNNVLLVETNIHNAGLPKSAIAPLYGQMLAKLRAIPGAISAGQCFNAPLSGGEWTWILQIPGRQLPTGVEPGVYMNWVTPEYFSTMQQRLLEGRTFDSRDSDVSTPVIIVNELLARQYFPKQDPVGKHLQFNPVGPFNAHPLEIVGVVQNARYDSLNQDFPPTAYFPLAQVSAFNVLPLLEKSTFEIRSGGNPTSLIPAVRDAIGSVNKLASLQFTTLKQQADDSVVQHRLLAVLSGFFAVLALLLTAIGLYGVMAYLVTLRSHEIGIRMALGAERGSILRLIMREAAVVLGIGIGAGLLGAIWITRVIQQLLFDVKPIDPWSLSMAVAALLCVAAIATYVPARRAIRIDPVTALRCE